MTDGWARRLGIDERAVSSTVTHVLAIAIGAILIGALITGMSGFLEDERERATRVELESLGARLADDVAAASQLARGGGNASLQVDLPERVVDTRYTVSIETGPPCVTGTTDSDSCLVLEAASPEVTVVQPLANRSAVRFVEDGDGDLLLRVDGTGTSGGGPLPELSVSPTVGVGGVPGISTGPGTIVNTDPVAGFVFRPGNPTAGEEIRFVNDTSDLDGIVESYEWRFELPNGGNQTMTGPTANKTYDTPGVYRVTLEVTDDEGETDTISRRVPVSGLVFTDAGTFDGDGNGDEAGVWFSLNNTWENDVEITTLGFDPTDPSIDGIEEDGDPEYEITFETGGDVPTGVDGTYVDSLGGSDGHVDFSGGTDIPPDGLIVDVDADGGASSGDNPEVAPGENVTVYLTELRDGGNDVDGADVPTAVALRYRQNGSVFVTKFGLFSLDDGDTVTWESASDWDAATSATNVSHPDSVLSLDAPAGSGSVPTTGLQVWLPLNETGPSDCSAGARTACDYAGGTNYQFDYQGAGNPTFGVPGVDGGTAYEFDGSVWLEDPNVEETYLGNADELTVSMWVKADATGTDRGLLDTVDDGGDSNDDELGLRYDSSGASHGGSNSFKASVDVAGDGGTEYSYEYESDVQTTNWQHVVMRWSAGERVEVFVDGDRLSYAGPDAATPPGAEWDDDEDVFFGIGRSQKDDLGALWEGRIDEVRIYDRALGDAEIEGLANDGGYRSGSLETDWKGTDEALDLADLRLGYDATLGGGTVQVTVKARQDDGTVVTADPLVLSGDNGVREVEGLTGEADEFKLQIQFSGVSNAPSADSFTLGD